MQAKMKAVENGPKVLVVGGHTGAAKSALRLLRERGYRTSRAENASSATRAIARELFDLVVVYLQPPVRETVSWLESARLRSEAFRALVVVDAPARTGFFSDFQASVLNTPLLYEPLPAEVLLQEIDAELARTPENGSPGAIEQELEALRNSYAQGLPEQVARLIQAVSQVHSQPSSTDALLEARRLAQNLRGTASSYGFNRVASSVGLVDETLQKLEAGETASDTVAMLAPTLRLIQGEAEAEALRRASSKAQLGSPAKDAADALPPQEACTAAPAARPALHLEVLASEERVGPRPKGEGHPPRPSPSLRSVDTGDRASRSEESIRQRILIVRNDATFFAQSEEACTRLGATAVFARSGMDAVRCARQGRLDAALLSSQLTDMHGASLARSLRGLHGQEKLPIAFVPGEGRDEEAISALHAGGENLPHLPLTVDSLEAVMKQMLAQNETGCLQVLHAQAEVAVAQEVSALLTGHGMRVTTVSRREELLQSLRSTPDVLLVDEAFPGPGGLDLCRGVRTAWNFRDLPILLLTSRTSRQALSEAYAAGVDDCVTRPILEAELLARVRNCCMRSQAFRIGRDPLTGLWMRQAFCEHLADRLERAAVRQGPVQFALLDLDHLKLINDVAGPLAGEEPLVAMGRLLEARFRRQDVRGRWGGGEFALAFEDVDAEVATGAIRRTLEEFREQSFPNESTGTFKATFSAGLATYPSDGEALLELLRVATRRLRLAKERGRNQVCHQG